MDIKVPVSTVEVPRRCQRRDEEISQWSTAKEVEPRLEDSDRVPPCGVCEDCRRVAMGKLARYAMKEEDPRGTLLDLLNKLGFVRRSTPAAEAAPADLPLPSAPDPSGPRS